MPPFCLTGIAFNFSAMWKHLSKTTPLLPVKAMQALRKQEFEFLYAKTRSDILNKFSKT